MIRWIVGIFIAVILVGFSYEVVIYYPLQQLCFDKLATQGAKIQVYFTTSTSDTSALALRDRLIRSGKFESATYESPIEQLAAFKITHANDQMVLQGLEEFDSNPFDPELTLVLKDARKQTPETIGAAIEFVRAEAGDAIVERISAGPSLSHPYFSYIRSAPLLFLDVTSFFSPSLLAIKNQVKSCSASGDALTRE